MGNNNTLWFIGIIILISAGHCGIKHEFKVLSNEVQNVKSLVTTVRSSVDDIKQNCR